MKNYTKALVGTVAAGAMALSSASPAMAQSRERHDRDNISTGEIIAGALILGGIVAVASAGSGDRDYDRDYRYDRAGYGDRDDYGRDGRDGYGRDGGRDGYGGNPRQAVEQCVRAAEREASRRYGRADVTDVRDIDRKRWGYEVKGRIAVRTSGRDWRRGDARYGSGWGGDYRGYREEHRGYDSGSFKCRYERGRVVDVDFGGIRGL